MTEQVNETTQEDADMATVRAVFEKALNGIIDASRLSKLVTELEARVNSLVGDVDYLRDRNKYLDEQMGYLRKARDEAESKNVEQGRLIERLTSDLDHERSSALELRSALDAMEARWHDASKERDEAMLREMELQDKLKAAEEQIASIRKVLGFVETKAEEPKDITPQETPPQFEHSETTEEKERREAQSRDEAGRFGPKVVGFDY